MMVSRRRFEVVAPDWGQAHLTSDAVVAFVDDELSSVAHTRAATHIRVCLECAAEVAAQIQARSALRAAQVPVPPSSLMHALRSIPGVAELPGPPAGLAMSRDGLLVQALRPVPMPSPPMPSSATVSYPSSSSAGFGSRRLRLGAAVAASGMALGAIVLVASADSTDAPAAPAADRGVFGGPVLEARLQINQPPAAVEVAQLNQPPAAVEFAQR